MFEKAVRRSCADVTELVSAVELHDQHPQFLAMPVDETLRDPCPAVPEPFVLAILIRCDKPERITAVNNSATQKIRSRRNPEAGSATSELMRTGLHLMRSALPDDTC